MLIIFQVFSLKEIFKKNAFFLQADATILKFNYPLNKEKVYLQQLVGPIT